MSCTYTVYNNIRVALTTLDCAMAYRAKLMRRLRKLCENGQLREIFTPAFGVEHLKREFDPDRTQPLHYAAARGDVEMVRDLIETYGCDPVCKNAYGITPMHCACYCGQLDIVKYLQKYCPIAISVEDNKGACPVVYTAYRVMYGISKFYPMNAPLDYFRHVIEPLVTHIETAKFLLSCMDPVLPPTLLCLLTLPLYFDSLSDLKDMISFLKPGISSQKLMDNDREIYHYLMIAVGRKKWDLVECMLLEFPEPIKAVIASGSQTPFPTVCDEADIKLIKLFLELDICEPDVAAIKVAFDQNDYKLLSYLLQSTKQQVVMEQYGNEGSSLLSRILSYRCSKRKKLIKLLVAHANNSRDSKGNTVLHLACKHSVQFLVKRYSSYYEQSAVNNRQQLPLHIACDRNNLVIIKLVSSQLKLNVNTRDFEGNTPLHVLCKSILHFSGRCVGERWKKSNFLKCLAYLLFKKKCDVNIPDDSGELPVHILLKNCGRFYCLDADDEEKVVLMLTRRYFTNINAQDCDGNTLLHIACKNKAWNIAHHLTRFRCNIDLYNNDKCLPLHYAVVSHQPFSGKEEADLSMGIIKAVSSGCTQIHLKNRSGMTPLHIACREIKLDVVQHLVKCSPNLADFCDVYDDLEVHLACRHKDDIDLLNKLVNKVNVNVPKCKSHAIIGYDKDTPLHTACSYGNPPAIELLTKLNCDYTLKNSEGMLPLHLACSRSLECVKLLHIQKDDVRIQDKRGNTPLHWACERNLSEVVNYLLSNFSCDITIENKKGELPLHLSCAHSLETVLMVLECDANCQTANGDTPLHIACKAGIIDVVQYLVTKCNCSPSMAKRNMYGKLPVHYACEHSLEMVKLVGMSCTATDLISRPINWFFSHKLVKMTALDIACTHGLLDIVDFLVNEKDCSLSILKGNQSALGYACGILKCKNYAVWNDDRTGGIHPVIAEYLITECGYDPTVSYEQIIYDEIVSISPIEHACKMKVLHLMKALTVLSIDIIDSKGNTPLYYACKYSCTEIVQFLIDHGCNQTIFNKKRELPIHIACFQSLEITQMLKECDVNAVNADGNTPLHITYDHDQVEIVFYLVKEAKCDVNIPNRGGDFVLHIACQRSLELTKLFLDYGCDVNCQDANGNTALHLACSSQQYEIVEHLISNKLCKADVENKSGDLPLHIIVGTSDHPLHMNSSREYKTPHIIEMILNKHRSALTTPNKDGATPIDLALKNGKVYLLEVLLKRNELQLTHEPESNFLHRACTYGQAQLVHDEGNLPEHLCISSAARSSLETLMKIRALDLKKKNKAGDTVLHLACKHDWTYMLEYILSNNDCSDAFSITNDAGDTPLHLLAAKKSVSPNILDLIKCNKPSVKNKQGNTPLHIACQNNNLDLVLLLLTLQSDLTSANDQGELPLHLAVTQSLEVTNLVVTSENVNAQTNNDDTPLHIACRHQNVRIILHLIEELRCSVQKVNKDNESPFHILLSDYTFIDITSILKYIPESLKEEKNKKGFTLLHLACWKANERAALFLIKSLKCSVDVTHEESGVTPLHFACGRGLMKIVKLVLWDCNPKAKIKDPTLLEDSYFVKGDTPLHTACNTGNARIIRYLLNRGHTQALHISNFENNLPVHLICQHKRVANRHGRFTTYPIEKVLAWLFVEYKAYFDSSSKNVSGDTPLHVACGNKPTHPYLEILINQMECRIDAVNEAGDLPLHVACRSGVISQSAIKLLVDGLSEDKVNLRNKTGNTALHELLKHPCKEHFREKMKRLTQLLVKEMNLINDDEQSIILLACRHQGLNVVEYLCGHVYGSVDKISSAVLHEACLSDDPGILEYIARKFDFDADVPNANGDLPLHLATHEKKSTLGTIELVKKTIKVNHRNSKGNTPLHELYSHTVNKSVLVYDRSQILLALLKKTHIDLSLKNEIGQTPLHCICEAREYWELKMIVDSGKKIDPNIQDDKGFTPLHIASQNDNYDIVHLLLSLPETNVSAKDKNGQTPIILTKHPQIVRLLLDHGADPTPLYNMHKRFFQAYSSETPPQTPMCILVVGNPSVGKTTLIQALRSEYSGCEIVADKFSHTAGVVPTEFSSKIYGDVMFYDFAGQPEYYASHDTIIHNIIKNVTPIILILVNLTDSRKTIRNQAHYWINFVNKRYEVAHIIIVCSHADKLIEDHKDPSTKVSDLESFITSELKDKHLVLKNVFYINCTQVCSNEMKMLQTVLRSSADELRDEKVMHFHSHCFYALLLQELKNKDFITLGHIVGKLKIMSTGSKENPLYLLPSDQKSVIQMCKELDGKGHIMFIENFLAIDMSWLVLNKKLLLNDLVGTLFGPSSMKSQIKCPLSYSTGVIPFSRFKEHFGGIHNNHSSTMKLTFLTKMEYCREITDKAILKSIVREEGYSETDQYHFFPDLVSLARPTNKWNTDTNYSYKCGWLIQCRGKIEDDSFSPHFIQALLLRLTFAFTPKQASYDSNDFEDSEDENDDEENQAMALVIKRTCSVWKNGLYWQERSGVKTIVEIIDQRKLILLMQCRHGSEIHLLERRSMIMSMVHEAKEEFSSKSNVLEYFLHPQCIKHPLTSPSKCDLFSLPQIEFCMVHREPYVINDSGADGIDLKKLLLFEPYFELSTDVIKKLSNEASFHEHINNDLLLLAAGDIDCRWHPLFMSFTHTLGVRVADKAVMDSMEASDETQKLACVLKQILTKRKPSGATHRDLYEFFNQMSIFCVQKPPDGMLN